MVQTGLFTKSSLPTGGLFKHDDIANSLQIDFELHCWNSVRASQFLHYELIPVLSFTNRHRKKNYKKRKEKNGGVFRLMLFPPLCFLRFVCVSS